MDGRRAERFRIFELILDQARREGRTASTAGVETYLRRLLAPWLLSPSAERQYVNDLMRLLRWESQTGKRVDLSTGMVRLVDVQPVEPSDPTVRSPPSPSQQHSAGSPSSREPLENSKQNSSTVA